MTFIAALTAVTISFGTMAADRNTVVVTPNNEKGFEETILFGGMITFVVDSDAPSGRGALRLTTDSNPESYAGYFKETNTLLADIRELSYFTKQNSGPAVADAAFALGVDFDGATNGTIIRSGFLVYEAYLQQNQTIIPGRFQFQDVDQGRIYSTATVRCSNGTVQNGSPGSGPFYTLADVQQICPEAVVDVFGVFIGTFNINYDVEVDLLNFNGTIFDFEPIGNNETRPINKEDCKKGGFRRLGPTFPTFRNQGQCVSFFNSRKKNMVNR